MKIKSLNIAIASVLLSGGIVMASNAQAAVITDSYTNAPQTTEINQSGVLDKFNTSLGTLNSATLTFTGNSLSSSVLTNNSPNSALFSLSSLLNFAFDATAIGVPLLNPLFTTTLATTGGFQSLAAGASLNLGPNSDSGSHSVTLTGAALGAVQGAGTFNTSCSTISATTLSGGGANLSNNQNTTAFCTGAVSYDYTETVTSVSSPASVLLLGAGLLGLAGARRTKKS